MRNADRRVGRAGALLAVLAVCCAAAVGVVAASGLRVGWWPVVAALGLMVIGVALAWGEHAAVQFWVALAMLAGGALLVFISTTPLRGLTPPAGTPSASVEPFSMIGGIAFIVIGIALAVGVRGERR